MRWFPKRNVFILFCQWGRPFYKFHLRKRRNICKWRPSPFNEENEWETSWLQNWMEQCSFKCSIPFITRISYFWNDTKPIKLYHLISFGCKDESEKQSEINIPWRHILHIFFLIFHQKIASSLSICSSTIPNHACREYCRYSSNWTPQLIREINLTKRRRKKRTTMHKKSYFCQEEWESMSQSELC